MAIYNDIYNYRIHGHNFDSQCRLLIPTLDSTPAISEEIDRGIKVIVSELPDNPGMSVCNAFESLARKICLEFEIDPQRLIYLEHWVKWTAAEGGYDREKEEYSLVKFEIIDNFPRFPGWKYLGEMEIYLIKQFLTLYP